KDKRRLGYTLIVVLQEKTPRHSVTKGGSSYKKGQFINRLQPDIRLTRKDIAPFGYTTLVVLLPILLNYQIRVPNQPQVLEQQLRCTEHCVPVTAEVAPVGMPFLGFRFLTVVALAVRSFTVLFDDPFSDKERNRPATGTV